MGATNPFKKRSRLFIVLLRYGYMVWYDVWLTLGTTPERSQWQRGGLHEPCKLLESSPSTSSRPREGAEMKMVWCSDYMLLLKAIGSIVDIMLFLEFFKVYLDFLNTRAHKCPTANLTQRLKVKVFLNSKMSSESQISTKKRWKYNRNRKLFKSNPLTSWFSSNCHHRTRKIGALQIWNISFKKSRLSQDISETYFLVGDVQ